MTTDITVLIRPILTWKKTGGRIAVLGDEMISISRTSEEMPQITNITIKIADGSLKFS
jgi:hypothetical protein